MKTYVKLPIPVKAKLFEAGDEDGWQVITKGGIEAWSSKNMPYVTTLEGKQLYGNFGEHYIVFGNHNDKWLVRRDIFEATYKEVTTDGLDTTERNTSSFR
jgi:hypothetical protein